MDERIRVWFKQKFPPSSYKYRVYIRCSDVGIKFGPKLLLENKVSSTPDNAFIRIMLRRSRSHAHKKFRVSSRNLRRYGRFYQECFVIDDIDIRPWYTLKLNTEAILSVLGEHIPNDSDYIVYSKELMDELDKYESKRVEC